ncbi:Zn(2)-C6 fungal-type domain-containing protein [Mycena indigotica]|uniref:Zn(2)-C6 fungal-type domain-containing protein n=1 Tax=Mycena indigotica TaxID=2126181 RepID=A0A8H6WC09_9AGAR|nr:Zn(2)-C6 fungal-type domain-containing protein [Mycena indigotica]KAF7309258.1 Zn(2)-C6 fungal-type domain-containing protein [Mycena indigotica]
MSAPRVRQKRLPKPPACDACKARRVLCHPQPNGAPCPRCAEKGVKCTTTYVPRGRPRQIIAPSSEAPPVTASSSSMALLTMDTIRIEHGPELTPQRVAHFFDCFEHLPQILHPLIKATNVRTYIRSVSFQLDLLPPQLGVLALCIIAYTSLVSFDESVLGPGLRPASLGDTTFFESPELVGLCGSRRAPACRAFHTRALRAAWDLGIMLQPSKENAASCWILDLLEQYDFSGLSRPWATAYISHVRALAPIWRATKDPVVQNPVEWAGFLLSEALLSTRSRKPLLVTLEDQLLLSGPEPGSMDELLATLESAASSDRPDHVVYAMTKPLMFHATILARTLWQNLTGDHARFSTISESHVIHFLSSLQQMLAILSHVLSKAELYLTITDANYQGDAPRGSLAAAGRDVYAAARIPNPAGAFKVTQTSDAAAVRACAYGLIVGFAAVALPFEQEIRLRLELLDKPDQSPTERRLLARLTTLSSQARGLTRSATRALARGIRLLPAVHYIPARFNIIKEYAKFALEDVCMETFAMWDPRLRDLEIFLSELTMARYSLDLSRQPATETLIGQIDAYLAHASMFCNPDNAGAPDRGLGAVDLDLAASLDPDAARHGRIGLEVAVTDAHAFAAAYGSLGI